jgi:hypothetical protein
MAANYEDIIITYAHLRDLDGEGQTCQYILDSWERGASSRIKKEKNGGYAALFKTKISEKTRPFRDIPTILLEFLANACDDERICNIEDEAERRIACIKKIIGEDY